MHCRLLNYKQIFISVAKKQVSINCSSLIPIPKNILVLKQVEMSDIF